MRSGDRFVWVSALGDPRQQPAHVRTIIRKHVMRDIGKSRRKSRQKTSSSNADDDQLSAQTTENSAIVPRDEEINAHHDMVLFLCRSLSNDIARVPLSYRMPAYFDATPLRRSVHGHLWQDFFHLDYCTTYQVDLMMATFFCLFEDSGTFDLNGPSVTNLRVRALQETQKAIEDPRRCIGLGTIAAIIASIFEAFVRGDIGISKMHLTGLRAVIAQRQRLLGISSLYDNFNICMLITSCELTTSRAFGILPTCPFPMSYFLPDEDYGPPRRPSRFSKLVDVAWNLNPDRHGASKRIYDRVIADFKIQKDQQPRRVSSSSATLFPTLFEDKQWIASYEASHHIVNPFVRAVARCLDEILLNHTLDGSASTIPVLRPMEFFGQDVLKLMILVRGISYLE